MPTIFSALAIRLALRFGALGLGRSLSGGALAILRSAVRAHG
jgi:hypothetical protein